MPLFSTTLLLLLLVPLLLVPLPLLQLVALLPNGAVL
jgi:hypothetical protein